jgi:2-iminoacetate synthase
MSAIPTTSFVKEWEQYTFPQIGEKIMNATPAGVRRALARAGGRIDMDDFAALISPAAESFLEPMAQISHRLTRERFGRTMQMFAPLYLTNTCANVCVYCGFNARNKIPRRVLNDAEIEAEIVVLKRMGFDHVLFLTGETSRIGRTYFSNAARLLRPHFSSISMEVQSLTTEDYEVLAGEGVSGVVMFQETYDAEVYPKYHLKGPKADMAFRLDAPDRMGQAGMKKIGLGALYGLSDWRTEAWFMALHLRHLEKNYWRCRYSVSFPRLRPHAGQAVKVTPFGERNLVQAITALRLLSHEAELTLSTRERPEFRDHAIRLGITSMSAASRTNPGGYATDETSLEQFAINDDRSVEAVVESLRSVGYEPVWKDWDPSYDGQPVAVRQ